MSDPVTNVEIEDVLSSIRRLVTEENRPEQRKAVREVPQTRGRLVLTPALRVPEESETSAVDAFVFEHRCRLARSKSEESDAQTPKNQDTAPAVIDGDSGEDRLQQKQVASRDRGTGEDGTPWRDPEATLFEAAQSAVDDDDEDAPEGDDGSDLDQNPDQETGAVSLHAYRIETEQQPEGDVPDETVVDHAEPEDQVSGSDGIASDDVKDPEAPHEQPLSEVLGAAISQPVSSDAATPDNTVSAEQRVASLSAKIEALEAAIGKIPDQWEPDGVVGDDYAGTPVETLNWQDHETEDQDMNDQRSARFGQFNQEDAPVEAPKEPDILDALASDETILDEESLRELVADIVREELQGALGERITRNVRKLVRREIHRALTAQELD